MQTFPKALILNPNEWKAMNTDDGPSVHEDDEDSTLWNLLGIVPPRLLDEKLAPAVDRGLLLQLARDQLPPATAKGLYRLIDSFQSWRTAFSEVSVNEYKASTKLLGPGVSPEHGSMPDADG